jgi:RHS repeat-associated protein
MKLSASLSIVTLACSMSVYVNANQSVSYTYNETGQVLTEDGPRTDVNDITTNTYNAKGLIATKTNALGHVTTYNSYDASGNALSVTDLNGVVTEFTYHERGWLLSSRLKHPTTASLDLVTSYTYDAVGQMLSTTLPNGVQIFYEYDDARRLTAVRNAINERIEYTLDAAGNRTQQVIKNAGGTITYSVSSTFDELSRVMKVIGNNGQQDQHQYDVNDNRTATIDGRTNTTQQTYDALNRVKKIIDPNLGETQFTYNSQDQIKTVTDARGNTTSYNYDGLGNLISQTSPDTGTTTFTYDAAGNRISSVDARGVVTNYTYDALNRLIAIQYPSAPAENVTYNYDATTSGNYGVGRLTSIVTNATRLDFEYNHQGLITKKYTQAGDTFATTQYRYDSAENLTGITYPSGREVNYQLDALGRISGITTRLNSFAPVQALVNNIGYLPFGPANSFQYGNNLTHAQTYDQDYRLTNIQVGGLLNRTYGYDPVNNITSIVNSLSNANSQSFSYDALNRLITANGGYGNLGYGYDAVGNRLSETRNGTSDTYQYEATSNRLTGIARANGNRNFTYDAAGNPIQRTAHNNSTQTYSFNKANRLSSVNVNGTQAATYTYNPLGQRELKTLANGNKEIYHYDEAGHLISVTDGVGATVREYIYWGNQQIALAIAGSVATPVSAKLDESGVTFQGSHVIARNNAGYFGAGFIDYMGEGQANWSFNAAATATYTFNLRYSLGGAPNRPLALLIDGVQKAQINFTATTNWTTWSSVQVSVVIPQGNRIISLKTMGQSGPNLDQVDVSYTVAGTILSLYYIHNDHLNTPQVMTNQSQQVVWMGNYEPFGKVAANANNSVEIFSRFPGQYLDNETGLYYNYFRDYDPSIGRYIESDPIGLSGGVNTYAYVDGNPLSWFDPLGLNKKDKWYEFNDPAFRDWVHQQKQNEGRGATENYTREELYWSSKTGHVLLRRFKVNWRHTTVSSM